MNENFNLDSVILRIKDLEGKVEEMNKKINSLQFENQELKKIVFARNDNSNFKRPASAVGLENPSAKKSKIFAEIYTPEIKSQQENKAKSEENSASSQRRQVMKDIVKEFHSHVLPRYQDHLSNERNQMPKLRTHDGRIILKNIRYIR